MIDWLYGEDGAKDKSLDGGNDPDVQNPGEAETDSSATAHGPVGPTPPVSTPRTVSASNLDNESVGADRNQLDSLEEDANESRDIMAPTVPPTPYSELN